MAAMWRQGTRRKQQAVSICPRQFSGAALAMTLARTHAHPTGRCIATASVRNVSEQCLIFAVQLSSSLIVHRSRRALELDCRLC